MKAGWAVIGWIIFGGVASWVALVGCLDQIYRVIPSEPLTLAFGLGLTVISLVGIVHSARRGPWWCLVPATVAAMAVIAGVITDSTLLLLGLTIPGFYS